MRFMVYREAMNAGLMIKFLVRVVRDAGRQMFLILDNLKVHHRITHFMTDKKKLFRKLK
jgi:hypothetical protein